MLIYVLLCSANRNLDFVHFVVRIEQLKNVMNESHAPRLHIAHLKNVEKRDGEVQGKFRLSGSN